jgi:2-haloacid dehalogenase
MVPRRHLLQAGLSMTAATLAAPSWPAGAPRFKAMVFDAFAVFDPGNVAALAETLFPGRGTELIKQWCTRQFEYTWLRAAAGNYADFMRVTDDSLVFAARSLGLELRGEHHDRLLKAWSELKDLAGRGAGPAQAACCRNPARVSVKSHARDAGRLDQARGPGWGL